MIGETVCFEYSQFAFKWTLDLNELSGNYIKKVNLFFTSSLASNELGNNSQFRALYE